MEVGKAVGVRLLALDKAFRFIFLLTILSVSMFILFVLAMYFIVRTSLLKLSGLEGVFVSVHEKIDLSRENFDFELMVDLNVESGTLLRMKDQILKI